MTEPFFSIVIPNFKADRHLGGNSRASWQSKYRKLKADKQLAQVILANQLNRMGLTGLNFLTNLGQYRLEECLPVHITYKRFYTGRAQVWDEDNLLVSFKGVQDGIKAILGCDDKYFKPVVEQIRSDCTELEVEITPAWDWKETVRG